MFINYDQNHRMLGMVVTIVNTGLASRWVGWSLVPKGEIQKKLYNWFCLILKY